MTISSLIAAYREREHHNVARILLWGLLGSIVLHGGLLVSIRWQAPPVALEPEEVEMVVLEPSPELDDQSLTEITTGEALSAGDQQAGGSADPAMEWGDAWGEPLVTPVAIVQPAEAVQSTETSPSSTTTPTAPLPSPIAATPQAAIDPDPIPSEMPSGEPSAIATPIPSPLATASPSPSPTNTNPSTTRPVTSAATNASGSADSRSATSAFSGNLSSTGLNTAAARGGRRFGALGRQPRAGNGAGIGTGNSTGNSRGNGTNGSRSGNSVGTAIPQPTAATSSPPPASNSPRQRPACISCPKPPSVRDGNRVVEGTARVIYDISPDGHPINIRLRVSSGHAALDRATLETVQQWRFAPSEQGYTGARQRVNFVDKDSQFHREVQEQERHAAEQREIARREAERRQAEQREAEHRAAEPQNRPQPTAGQPSPQPPATSEAPASPSQPASSASPAPVPPTPIPSPTTTVPSEPAPVAVPTQEPPPTAEPALPEPAPEPEPLPVPELPSPTLPSSP